MLIVGVNRKVIKDLKEKLNNEFKMKDIRDASKILGIEIIRKRDDRVMMLSQQ